MATEIIRYKNYDVIPIISHIAMRSDVFCEIKNPIITGVNHDWFVLFFNEYVTGFLCMQNKKSFINLCHFYVAKDFRNKMMGTALVLNALQTYKNCLIRTTANKSSARIFFKCGFCVESELKNYTKMTFMQNEQIL